MKLKYCGIIGFSLKNDQIHFFMTANRDFRKQCVCEHAASKSTLMCSRIKIHSLFSCVQCKCVWVCVWREKRPTANPQLATWRGDSPLEKVNFLPLLLAGYSFSTRVSEKLPWLAIWRNHIWSRSVCALNKIHRGIDAAANIFAEIRDADLITREWQIFLLEIKFQFIGL